MLCAFRLLMGGFPIGELIGIVVAHLYFFLVDLYPLSGGKQLLSTPRFLRNLFADDANYNRQQAQGNAPHSANTNNGARQTWGGAGHRLGGEHED